MNNKFNSTFKANLLKTIANKKGNKGFTLIELLVVVIIVGVLAAIALPNLLGQVGKARESEAKSMAGAVNRAQQAYFTERAEFASSLTNLEVPAGDPQYYNFSIQTGGLFSADGVDNEQAGTRDYESGVQYAQDTRAFATLICRSTTGADYVDASVTTAHHGSIATAVDMTCDAGEAVK
ncbi:MAG: type IV pilin-like G/H family protein [Crocosphaera sp.]